MSLSFGPHNPNPLSDHLAFDHTGADHFDDDHSGIDCSRFVTPLFHSNKASGDLSVSPRKVSQRPTKPA
jgi:hypothetical protein